MNDRSCSQAERIADRVISRPDAERADELFRLALQREPTEKERSWAAQFLGHYREALENQPGAQITKASWSALARVILASNEFLFVE
jgi:hypothetical protein